MIEFQFFPIVIHLCLVGSLGAMRCPIDGAVYRFPLISMATFTVVILCRNNKCLNLRYNRTILRRSAALSGSGRWRSLARVWENVQCAKPGIRDGIEIAPTEQHLRK